jgi:predicted nucleotidyltransferase
MAAVTEELISSIAGRVVEAIHPEKIILFGSRAWGEPDEASDVDLFVVVAESDLPAYRRAVPVYRALRGIGIPVDVIVQTRAEVERSRHVKSSLAWRVMEEGRVVYG